MRHQMDEEGLELQYAIAIFNAARYDPPPVGKRFPFGWKAAAVGGGENMTARLCWPDDADLACVGEAVQVRLRITAALDVREELQLEAVAAESRRRLGVFDIRYASPLQPFEIELSPAHLEAILGEGLELQPVSGGNEPFRILAPDPAFIERAPLLFPHLLLVGRDADRPGSRVRHMLRSLASLSSLQPFGWLEGCVLDGLTDLGRALADRKFEDAAREHLGLFCDANHVLTYEDPRSEPADGRVYGIEGTLPFAAWARLQPDHPALERAIDLWRSRTREDGVVCGSGMLSAEGSYTVAYPMAVLARVRGDAELAEKAVRQLEVRREQLSLPGGELHLRSYADGSRTFRHWARAHAWYLLGLIRTLNELRAAGYSGSGVSRCADEFVRAANVALGFQANDGLWSVFVDEPSTGTDASGSAGIAAALALGANAGLLPASSRTAAGHAWQALLSHLTPDGILAHVAQSNKGGEALQRSGYRVMFQMASGLLGQLYAALRQ